LYNHILYDSLLYIFYYFIILLYEYRECRQAAGRGWSDGQAYMAMRAERTDTQERWPTELCAVVW